MDKFFNSSWFVKIISFFIAFMLFVMVNFDTLNKQPSGGLSPITQSTYTLEEVEVIPYYNEDQYVITEMTETVQVNLKGPQSVLTLFQVTRPAYEVYIDLTDRTAGIHHVNIRYKNFPNDVNVTVVPQFARVVLQEKKTVSLPVEVELENTNQLAEGYSIGEPIVTPVNVEITAAEDIVAEVAKAKAFVDVKGANKTIEKSFPVKLYNHQGNEIELDTNPSVVDIRVPITSPYKEVPLKINRQGQLPNDLSIHSITNEPKTVTIYGPQNVLNSIDVLETVPLDLSKITENQTVQLSVRRPRGIEKVNPEMINVIIELSEEETKEVENIPIEILGLRDGLNATIITPENNAIDVIAKGSKLLLEKVSKEDIQAYVDVHQLAVGEFEIPVQIVGPQNLLFGANVQNVLVKINELENEEQ